MNNSAKPSFAKSTAESTSTHINVAAWRHDDTDRIRSQLRGGAGSRESRKKVYHPMTSAADDKLHIGQRRTTTAREQRARKSGGAWVEPLRRSDVGRVWTELQRLVVNHPLVRASHSAGLLVEEGDRGSAYLDLTQELFVTLLAKSRFRHYVDTAMTDAEIECEIGQIELTNLLTTELRKRFPESYRLARRISTIIQASGNFSRRDNAGASQPGVDGEHRRLVDRIYGLSEWRKDKTRRSVQELEQRVKIIPVQQRETRMVGCTGDAQIIISNSELEALIVSVFKACDSPTDVRTLRSLVMSRLPVMDIYLVPINGDGSATRRAFEPVDGGENPEQSLLRRESEREASAFVDNFLKGLQAAVRGKPRQYDRMLGVLWYCFLSPVQMTQLSAAAHLNVSDSLVSDYRHRIEQKLRALRFMDVEEGRRFEIALRERVRMSVVVGDEETIAV